jgi:hypothetical protein
MTMSTRAIIAAVLLFLGLAEPSAADVSPDEARAIAKEAYIYGFPMVDSYRIEYAYFVDANIPDRLFEWMSKFVHSREAFLAYLGLTEAPDLQH